MLVDHHCHLDYPELAAARADLMARAAAAGVGLMVTISTRVRDFDIYRAIAEVNRSVYFSVGTHPHQAHEELDIGADKLAALSAHPKCVAIGEAGLDYYYKKSPPEAQAAGLRTHIAAARATGLPLIVHARDADTDMAAILEDETSRGGAFPAVMHCFTSGADLARRALALGHYISFSGVITFKKSDALRAIAAEVPLDRLLVETDAPFLAPEPHRGKPNEPAFVVHTADALAKVRGVTPREIAAATTENFFRLYAKVPRHAPGGAKA
ncbi:MAG: TatD family hydrolase [Hyphomicrobiaceae bacterium]